MDDSSPQQILLAKQEFMQARRRAALEQIIARLSGRPTTLLSYDEVREKLRARGGSAGKKLRDIPLDAIVGSVGRYADFTRSFLPKTDSAMQRWARVMKAVTDPSGVPPIEVYQIGDAYFVLDGNHRVSVARDLGATYIQAYVREIPTRVPLSPDDRPDDLILKAEYAEFLEQTNLDRLRPGADLSVTVPGQYERLAEHIAVHRYFMGLEQQREIPYEEAVAHFYDTVYLPVVEAIRAQGILEDFPGRTEADLYLWLAEHRAELQDALGIEVEPAAAAADLASQRSARPQRVVSRLGEKLKDVLTPDELDGGPRPGLWREQHLEAHPDGRVFTEILVPVSGEGLGWHALDQALVIAQREQARLHGLHVVRPPAELGDPAALAIQAEFERRCQETGIVGKLVLTRGEIARQVCERARFVDLVVVNLTYPPGPRRLAKLNSGFRTLLRRCPGPVLAVPGATSRLSHALLAYDGRPKAWEALFLATYLAARWQVQLTVLTVDEKGRTTTETLQEAVAHLEEVGIEAAYLHEGGPVGATILASADRYHCDFIMMGSYGYSPVLEVVLGSAVDEVLRKSRLPILICR